MTTANSGIPEWLGRQYAKIKHPIADALSIGWAGWNTPGTGFGENFEPHGDARALFTPATWFRGWNATPKDVAEAAIRNVNGPRNLTDKIFKGSNPGLLNRIADRMTAAGGIRPVSGDQLNSEIIAGSRARVGAPSATVPTYKAQVANLLKKNTDAFRQVGKGMGSTTITGIPMQRFGLRSKLMPRGIQYGPAVAALIAQLFGAAKSDISNQGK